MNNIVRFLTTEQRNPNTRNIDSQAAEDILYRINDEDRIIADAVRSCIPDVAAATELIVSAFRQGGRLLYFGAGTSGRLGVLDASECPPTFGTDKSMVQGIIAGGPQAFRDAVEGAEDSEEEGARDVDRHGVSAKDVVAGISASGRTPYVLGAMSRAREIGATVVGICNNENTPMRALADRTIEAVVGPEVILGSTRMKAGTAQKLILNMLTTASMIRIGKVYDNLMVDMKPSNEKLVDRCKRIIRMATNASDDRVEAAYSESGGHAKTAIVMLLANTDAAQARMLLEHADGFVAAAVGYDGGRRAEL